MSESSRTRFVRWAEAAGVIGVAVSLVFVGLQIRQSTAIARAEAYQSFVSEMNEISLAALDPVVSNALSRRYLEQIPYEELTGVERSALLAVSTAYIRTYEGVYRQIQTGVLDESAYSLVDGAIADDPQFRFAWAVQRTAVSPDFRAFLEARHPFLQ